MPREREPRRTIIVNPDEPRTGDYGFGLRDKAHPVFGEKDTVNYLRGQLKGLRGESITVRLHGFSMRSNGTKQRFRGVEREIVLNKYSDVFGPNGAYDSMLYEAFRDADSSDDTIVVTNLTVDVN